LKVLYLLLFIVGASLAACEQPASPPATSTAVRVDQGMGSAPDPGFARALEARPFDFPRDHGAHPAYATEWWYFTGNLRDARDHRFGYQLTLFRVGLRPGEPAQDSHWRAQQLYMGHLAVSDIGAAMHYREERFSRAAAGLAGATADPLRVWLGPWSIRGRDNGLFPLHLSAQAKDIGIDLSVGPGSKPLVAQGAGGLSRKGAAPGNASYYYSFTRLPTAGELRIGDARHQVTGDSWFDREWSSSALAADQAGWDWFALHLDDGRDLMFYRMRGKDGQAQSFSSGVLVGNAGPVQRLGLGDVELEPTRTWHSPDGIAYPVAWRLRVPGSGLDLVVEAAFDAQQMDLSVSYWEGAVVVSGSHAGVGYLELSGYAP
jgi:predicted secreted hydrolase